MMILEEASKMCEETLLPLNVTGDTEGCVFDNGKVIAPKGFKEAYKYFQKMDGKVSKLKKNMEVKIFLT